MLCLQRREGQTIVITPPHREPIVITVTETRSGFCRLGIQAEKDVKVMRGEVAEQPQN